MRSTCERRGRQLLPAIALLLVIAAAGCSCRITPEMATPGTLPAPAVLRLGNVKESWDLPMGQKMPVGYGLEVPVREALSKPPVSNVFSGDAQNLVVDVDMRGKIGGQEEALLWGLICGFTLGLGPAHVRTTADVLCEINVRTPEGQAVRSYSFNQQGEISAWAYPPGLISLLCMLPSQEKWFKQVQAAMVSHIVAKTVERLSTDHAALVQARETRIAALSRAPGPVPPATPPVPPPTPPAPVPEALPPIAQRWAVIVGVSEYRHAGIGGLTNLRYAARDAEQLYGQLVGTALATWPKDNVRLLTNKDATERAVRDALLTFLKKAQKDDLVLIFFSGHGTPDPARPKNNYFLCHDTNPENLTVTGFPMWEIDNALERGIIEAKRVVLLADACHSGGFAPEGMRDIRVVSRSVSEGFQALGKQAACRVVTSCEPGELSQEKADWGEGHGAFAHALIQGLAGKADATAERNARGNGDGKVDLDELVYYLRRQVGDLTSNAQHVQDSGRLNATLIETKK